MEGPKTIVGYICYFIFFLPVFFILFFIGLTKGFLVMSVVFMIIAVGDQLIMSCLFPVHFFWSIYAILRTKKFGPYMKCLLILTFPIPLLLWTVGGLTTSVTMGLVVGLGWPFMETFKAISKESDPFNIRVKKCFTDGMRSSLKGALTIVKDYKDFSIHSFFSVVNELLKYEGDEPIELKVIQIPGCFLAGCIGIVVDVPIIIIITIYKAPVLLFKGWYRLVKDLIGREGPFLETVCVPFAGESSTKRGFMYIVAATSVFDEYTNDLLYLREGSCYPRPKYRKKTSSGTLLPVSHGFVETGEPLVGPPSMRKTTVQAIVIWESFIKACEDIGKVLLRAGAIAIADLEAWKESKNKILNIGIPAYAILQCFLSSIKNGSTGFLLRYLGFV